MEALNQIPFRKIDFLPRDIDVERRADGVIVLRSRIPLDPYERHLPAFLRRWAGETPDETWLAQRRGPDRQWMKVNYAQARRIVDSVTQALLDLKVPDGRPVMILSANSIEHALMTMAAMQARLPAAPVSAAYSLMSQDHGTLKYVFELLEPAVVLVQNARQYERALRALDLTGVTLVYVDDPVPGLPGIAWSKLAATPAGPAVEASVAAIEPQTVGKYLLTSGSTGTPKAVINTQQMMCANVTMGQQSRPRRPGDPRARVLDWMPWNHTMGGNASFNGLLADGGTLYIDEGRPTPELFGESLRNLRELSPTYYANVPAGFSMLIAALEKDEVLARGFFKDLQILGYGGATLPDDLYVRMQRLAVKYTGTRIVFFTGWGSTETAPTATATYWATERVGLIGLPFPGIELKMVPNGAKYELRLRGVTVMPGYLKRPDLTAAAFDEEGFYKIGDAGVFVDPADPAQGLIFGGRVVEDFKLNTGTFVHVGSLRVAAVAAASPVLQDAVVTGHDRAWVGLLAWPSLAGCRQLIGDPNASLEQAMADARVRARIAEGLAAHNKAFPGSSMRIRAVLLMAEPPSIDGRELTDKGYINQR
ncbi:MAG TPA: AMP-binding protein, partial [Burkholderiaceae bacterium]|nr:AMP-binding protein [Burkholderiaceae bacterium]